MSQMSRLIAGEPVAIFKYLGSMKSGPALKALTLNFLDSALAIPEVISVLPELLLSEEMIIRGRITQKIRAK
jgi:hypothetical protein